MCCGAGVSNTVSGYGEWIDGDVDGRCACPRSNVSYRAVLRR